MQTKFYSMQTAENKAILNIYGDICGSSFDKWSNDDKCPQDIVDFVQTVPEDAEIEIHINSGGGDLFGGIAIYNVLSRCKQKKTAYIDGIAASAASIVALAADSVTMGSGSQFMIHKPMSFSFGNAEELREMANLLDKFQNQMVEIYCSWSEKTAEEISAMVDAETWMSGKEAAEVFGFSVEERQAVACAKSEYYRNYKHLPQNLLKEQKNQSESPPVQAENQTDFQLLQLELDLY